MPPLPPKKGESAKRAQQTNGRESSDLKLDPKQDIPSNSTSSISSPTTQPHPIQARAPKPFSNSERPRSYHVQDSVAMPEPVETPQQQQPLPQTTQQEEKSKLLVPEPVVIVQPSSGMT